ncbi:MAG: hypothetical protein AAFR58_16195 [Cyanobacteria bacterium J06627_28]
MFTPLIEALVQAIRALSAKKRTVQEKKLFLEANGPTSHELAVLALKGGSFDFLADEPAIYSYEDGEAIDS